jgi:signal transduction histidine kinase
MKLRRSADGDSWSLSGTPVLFAAGLCCAIAMLVWLGYVSTREWQREADTLLRQRETETLALASTALARDMKGMWTTVLAPTNVVEIEDEAPFDVMRTTARAFARFPYPESFIMWRAASPNGATTLVFNRTDRLPAWVQTAPDEEPYPVSIVRNPDALAHAIELVRDSKPITRFVSINTEIGGVRYQIVAHRMFQATPSHPLGAMAAFTVNLDWVSHEYFGPLLRQVTQIGGNQEGLALSVTDSSGRVVATSDSAPVVGPGTERPFPLLFLDNTVASAASAGEESPFEQWTLHVAPTANNPLLSAQNSSRQMFFLMVLAAIVSTTALLMTVRAVRTSAALASMKSDFVAAVTHELKTPVAAIRLVGDTLARKRYDSVDTVADYAKLLSEEAARLSRSIDGLLIYSKYTEARQAPPASSPFDIADVVEDAVENLRPLLAEAHFDVAVDVPRALAQVSADRPALVQVVECIIDNAMKYSSGMGRLNIVGRMSGGSVTLSFKDRGIGIPAEDLPRVFDRFYRGHNVTAPGSGLGLTIARRILQAHGGTIGISSEVNVGTEVTLSLPAASHS